MPTVVFPANVVKFPQGTQRGHHVSGMLYISPIAKIVHSRKTTPLTRHIPICNHMQS